MVSSRQRERPRPVVALNSSQRYPVFRFQLKSADIHSVSVRLLKYKKHLIVSLLNIFSISYDYLAHKSPRRVAIVHPGAWTSSTVFLPSILLYPLLKYYIKERNVPSTNRPSTEKEIRSRSRSYKPETVSDRSPCESYSRVSFALEYRLIVCNEI